MISSTVTPGVESRFSIDGAGGVPGARAIGGFRGPIGNARGARRRPLLILAAFFTIIAPMASHARTIKLPPPAVKGSLSVEEAIAARRTIREFTGKPITEAQLSLLLWAAQGITEPRGGLRASPSAGALYPLEIYVALGEPAGGLKQGIYRYLPSTHSLEERAGGEDRRAAVARAALGQDWMSGAAAIFLVAAANERTTRKYGERGYRYVQQEAGFAAENLLLEAVSLGLRSATVGAFYDREIAGIFTLPASEQPLLLLPVGP